MATNRPLRAVGPDETAQDAARATTKKTAAKAPVKKTAAKRLAAKRAPAKTATTPKKAPAKRAIAIQGAPPKKKPVKSLVDAIEHGSYEDVLVWQRKEAVKSLATLGGPALAAMHRQIAQLSKEIESIRAAKTEGTDIGESADLPDEEYDPDED
ncbi:hypothetical protein P5P86_11810 [Nocardioides sp. BP30]|uniref:hypothetical protein n=1 Tax=Nocardioides sp. BP30 TaxID=3036374 RepID=UPI0024686C03|nr:hypothetical protein [Nocardioides sp. BP30]WGL50650.1 hypothetical protein P5P86_11810 [Nocardioides sp. BP30]